MNKRISRQDRRDYCRKQFLDAATWGPHWIDGQLKNKKKRAAVDRAILAERRRAKK